MKKQVFKSVFGVVMMCFSLLLSRLLDIWINQAYNEAVHDRLVATGPVNQLYGLADNLGTALVMIFFLAGLSFMMWGVDGVVKKCTEKNKKEDAGETK